MSIVEGFLTEVESKTGVGKGGKPWAVYRGQIQGHWYSFGFEKPPVSKGDYVRAEIGTVKGYEQVVRAERITAPEAQKPLPGIGQSVNNASGNAANNFVATPSGGYQDRNSSIVYQSSRKDALEFVKLLRAEDALPISVAKTAAGKAKRYDELLALVDKITVQFYYDVNTLRNLERVQDAGADGPAPEALPEDGQPDPEVEAIGQGKDTNW